MIVMKFGGASMRDADALKKVGAIIKSRLDEQPVVVISAVNGVTNHLVDATNQAFNDECCIPDILSEIATIHRKLASGAISSPPIRTSTQQEINQLLARLERVLYGIAYTGECTPRTRDLILTFGERMSIHLLVGHLRSIDCEAQPLYADEIDMVAHGPWGAGTTHRDEVRELLPAHIHAVVDKKTGTGDYRLFRANARSSADYAGPRRHRLQRGRHRRCDQRRAARSLERCGWLSVGRARNHQKR